MTQAIGRAFLVGSPRSGTTLLQSLLTAHPSVVSFPETFFFEKVVPRAGLRRRLGLASARTPEAIANLDALGIGCGAARDPGRLASVGRCARIFTARMDAAARRADASLWLEKTPGHLRYVAEIERHVPRARIVHLVRAGEAVVASLHEVKQRHPDVWHGPEDLDELVGVWRANLHRTRDCVGRPNHAFVSYERLVEDPAGVMAALCAFLDLRGDSDAIDQVLAGYGASAAKVTGRVNGSVGVVEEPWKATVAAPISNRNDAKFRALFSEAEQAVIREAVARERAVVESIPYL